MTALADAAAPTAKGAALPVQIGYGVGQIAGQVFRDLPSLLLMFYMTTVLGIRPDLAGAVIFVPKLVVGLSADMAVGILSDRLRNKVARRWWLLAGVVLSPLAMILLFHVPDGDETAKLIHIGGAFSLYMAVFASFSVPYLSLAGELTTNAAERNHIMAWRLVFTAIGVLVAGALAPAVVSAYGGGQAGYEMMAIVLAVICPIALLIAFLSTRNRAVEATPRATLADTLTTRLSVGAAMAKIFRSRFTPLLGVNLMQLTGAGMGYAALLYFLSYNMARPDAFQIIGGIVLAACAGIIVAQPAWVKLSARWGKKSTYIAATLLYAGTYVVWGFGASWGAGAAYVLSFIAALGNSGWAMLGFSMMSDVAAEDAECAGLYSAAWIACDKIAFALGGTLLVGLILSAYGFDSAKAVQGLPQVDSALTGIVMAFAVVPVTLNVLAVLVLAKFSQVGLRGAEA